MSLREQVLQYYTILEERESADLNATVYQLCHKQSGARVAIISNDDENKTFYIGFRTPPTDSTGVPHILEHCVLCGSKNFPVKDPFIELAKGSLNTFLNAITYPDRTLYPIASVNDADFQNLMHIYLDAVFYPNIYQDEEIFKQEGWHYELQDLDAPLTINGVVYNEMKGAFSDSDDLMEREIMNALFPDTCYGVESGGDPEVIPELTYEQFLNFHSTLYHPANSYIYLYGNMDAWEKLMFIHKEYLAHFSKEDVSDLETGIQYQQAFDRAKEIVKPYPILEGEDTACKTHFSYNVVTGTTLEKELCVALEVLDYALCSAPGAPLKKALIDAGIGNDVYSEFNDGMLQPYFSIVAKEADLDQKEAFLEIIESELKRIVKEGFDKRSLMAALNYFEFRYREADFGRNPKGLIFGLEAMGSWNYKDDAPFLHLEANETYAFLKEKVDEGYFEDLVEKYLLNNTHKAIVVMVPEAGLATKRDQIFEEKMATLKASMSKEALEEIIAGKERLEARQDKEDSPEALATIPLLKREDLGKEIQKYVNELKKVGDIDCLTHPIFTNGIAYIKLIFDAGKVPQHLFPYLSILRACMGYMDTAKYSYSDLFNETNLVSGGIAPHTGIYTNANDYDKAKVTFELKAKVMYDKMPETLALMMEMLLATNYRDKKRMREIISEGKSKLQSQIMGASHRMASLRAMSYFSPVAAIGEELDGISVYQLYEDLDKNFDAKFEEIVTNLETLCKILFRKENFMADITAEETGIKTWMLLMPTIEGKLHTEPVETGSFEPVLSKKNEGFTTSGQVQYVCRAGNFHKKGLVYTGALRVLKVIMGYEYLWTQVRVKGGAYGCMCSFGKTGDSYFVSYRDPHLKNTIDVYENAAKAIAEFDGDERTMTQYVIGAISEMDTPMTPATLGAYSLGGFLTGRSEEDLQTERNEVLHCTSEDIRALAPFLEAFMSDEALCVVGNADKLAKDQNLFDNIVQLF